MDELWERRISSAHPRKVIGITYAAVNRARTSVRGKIGQAALVPRGKPRLIETAVNSVSACVCVSVRMTDVYISAAGGFWLNRYVQTAAVA